MGIRHRKIKSPAVFIDRDGTIMRQVDLPHQITDFHVFRTAAPAIRTMNEAGYRVIMVSNQPVVARGMITLAEAEHLNSVMIGSLHKQGARIDAAYLCPHHPMANMARYRKVCSCRKPGIGMFLRAAREHSLDLKRSFMIGDSTQDIAAANRAGLKMILVKTGFAGKDAWQHEGKPDFVAHNLLAAARIIRDYQEPTP